MRGAFGLFFGLSVIFTSSASFAEPTFPEWIKIQEKRSFRSLVDIYTKPADKSKGAVPASPSKKDPNYYFHWVRDAALVTEPFVAVFLNTKDETTKQAIFHWLHDYVEFSRELQGTPNKTPGFVGEPKFYVDGRAFDEPWGRPQTDGPALRTLKLIPFAMHLLDLGKDEYVRSFLFDPTSPGSGLMGGDMSYVSEAWAFPTFDLWEEVLGDHFYSLAVQRRAFLELQRLSNRMGDPALGKTYEAEAHKIEERMSAFWKADLKRIVPTLRAQWGPAKASQLDTAVILAAIHTRSGKAGAWEPSDDRVISTAHQLIKAFRALYPINQQYDRPGIAIGRYPEDTYDGVRTNSVGNPWFLTTLALAEYSYALRLSLETQEKILISDLNLGFLSSAMSGTELWVGMTLEKGEPAWNELLKGLVRVGDAFVARAGFHMNRETGAMSEQIDRHTGFMRGAEDLSWSYAAFLSAVWTRERILRPSLR